MKTWNDYPPTLTTQQASEILSISINTITARCKTNKLPATKIGKSWHIDRDQLRAMFAVKFNPKHNLVQHLGEIELTLSTLAAVLRGTAIEETLRKAHTATLKAYNQARGEE